MRYLFHKIGLGNSDVSKYLVEAQVGGVAKIANSFGESTVQNRLSRILERDAQNLCRSGEPPNRSSRFMHRETLENQAKSWMRNPPRVVEGVFFVALNLNRKDRGKGWDVDALWAMLQTCPKASRLLGSSLYWLPENS